jgi:hypothetical protein
MTTIINIKKYLPSGTQFADSKYNGNVSVTVGIEPVVTKELRIPAKNFAAGNKPEGFDVTLKEADEDEYYAIKISGTQSAVNSVEADTVIGVIDMDRLLDSLELEEWKEGSYTSEITFNLPDDVTLAEKYEMTIVLENTEEEQ